MPPILPFPIGIASFQLEAGELNKIFYASLISLINNLL